MLWWSELSGRQRRAEPKERGVRFVRAYSSVREIMEVQEHARGFTSSQPRAQLVADDEQTGLLLYDRSGQVRARLVVSEDQPKLVFLDKDGEAVYSAP